MRSVFVGAERVVGSGKDLLPRVLVYERIRVIMTMETTFEVLEIYNLIYWWSTARSFQISW